VKFQKTISFLVFGIVVLALIASAAGLFLNDGPGSYEFKSLHGQTVTIYGKGLYRDETLKLGPQARGQDAVTLFLIIPLLIFSFFSARKGSLKGQLLLTGTLGYFMYTYTMYTFISYNPLYLLYIVLMTISLYAFILAIMSFNMKELGSAFNNQLPIRFIAGFQIFSAFGLGMRWLSDLISALINDTVPLELDHYTSIAVYSMDLGLVVPTFIVAAVLLIQRKPFGYLLTSLMIIKSVSMWLALTGMTVAASFVGVKMSFAEMAMAPFFGLISIFILVLILKNVKEPVGSEVKGWGFKWIKSLSSIL